LPVQWPDWWKWELEITPHLEKRMADRVFTEVDLRTMLEDAEGYQPDIQEGRWVIESRFRGVRWEVIVEPDASDRLLVAVTAYPSEA
jgi:hypothetical protein